MIAKRSSYMQSRVLFIPWTIRLLPWELSSRLAWERRQNCYSLSIFWKLSLWLGSCRIELYHETVFGREFWPSFLCNLVTANKRKDDVTKTVPYWNSTQHRLSFTLDIQNGQNEGARIETSLGLLMEVNSSDFLSKLGRFVPKVDNAIHWENLFPMESVIGFFDSCPIDSYLLGE